MEWSDEGFVLSTRRHGEGDIVLSLLTREHGRHAGLVKGGGSRRAAGLYEPGNRLRAVWRARLSEHLGAVEDWCHRNVGGRQRVDERVTLASTDGAGDE